MERVVCIVIGYIFGLFQTGFIYGKIKGVDIRSFGSGNTGTTNTMRVLGKKAGIITYIGDVLKVILASLLTMVIFGNGKMEKDFVLLLYTGLGVVLGHNFPFYMNFKGGKGIAASSGVIIALFDWKLIIIAFFTFLISVVVTKYVSVGSLAVMTGFFVELIIFGQLDMIKGLSADDRIEAYIIAFVLMALAYIRHKENIKRLINGNENKIGQKKKEAN